MIWDSMKIGCPALIISVIGVCAFPSLGEATGSGGLPSMELGTWGFASQPTPTEGFDLQVFFVPETISTLTEAAANQSDLLAGMDVSTVQHIPFAVQSDVYDRRPRVQLRGVEIPQIFGANFGLFGASWADHSDQSYVDQTQNDPLRTLQFIYQFLHLEQIGEEEGVFVNYDVDVPASYYSANQSFDVIYHKSQWLNSQVMAALSGGSSGFDDVPSGVDVIGSASTLRLMGEEEGVFVRYENPFEVVPFAGTMEYHVPKEFSAAYTHSTGFQSEPNAIMMGEEEGVFVWNQYSPATDLASIAVAMK